MTKYETDNKFTKPSFPEVTVNKNGYTIRTELLGFAQKHLTQEYDFRIGQWASSGKFDEATGKYIQTIERPEVPGIDKVIEAAEKMYQFVCKNTK